MRINPDEKFNAAQCLKRECRKHFSNEIVIMTSFEKCNTSKKNTEKTIEISTHYAFENETIMSTQFFLKNEIETNNILRVFTILDEII